MASFADVVAHVRKYAPFFTSVTGAATYELAETQLNGLMPACVVVPAKFAAAEQTNMTGVYRSVVETYDLLVALDNTTDRAGVASSVVALDDARDATRGAMDGWVPRKSDGTSDYLFGFAFEYAESIVVNGAKSYWSFKYSATRIMERKGSFLDNPIYLADILVVGDLDPVANVALLSNGTVYANLAVSLS